MELFQLLQEELAQARLRNPAYSLRAFARKLDLAPSAVSEILNGKRAISRKMAEKLLERLMCSPAQKERILKSLPGRPTAPALSARGVASEESADPTLLPTPIEIKTDEFHAVSDWHHFAILSLAETRDFQADEAWISNRLNLNRNTARVALERLLRLGLLAVGKGGKIQATGKSYTTSDDIANISLRRSHAQNLELARASLDNDPIERRDFTAITMAIDPALLSEAKKRVRAFRDRLCAFLESGEKKEVYKLCIQLIPLSCEAEIPPPRGKRK